MPKTCFHCRTAIQASTIRFRETCETCASDVHVCRNCKFYDPGAHHECRESSADYVKDKEKNNRCEYFRIADSSPADQSATADTMRALEDLFKS